MEPLTDLRRAASHGQAGYPSGARRARDDL
jgi:hypothetical protein